MPYMNLPLETARLRIAPLTISDAGFILELLNDAGFIRYIVDKGVRDITGAENYLRTGPLASYAAHGFGLWKLSLRADGTPIGMCGLLQRDYLPVPDLGYALLGQHCGRGYAQEACGAVMTYAQHSLHLNCLQATTLPDNAGSIRVLEKLGFGFVGTLQLHGEMQAVNLYQRKFATIGY